MTDAFERTVGRARHGAIEKHFEPICADAHGVDHWIVGKCGDKWTQGALRGPHPTDDLLAADGVEGALGCFDRLVAVGEPLPRFALKEAQRSPSADHPRQRATEHASAADTGKQVDREHAVVGIALIGVQVTRQSRRLLGEPGEHVDRRRPRLLADGRGWGQWWTERTVERCSDLDRWTNLNRRGQLERVD